MTSTVASPARAPDPPPGCLKATDRHRQPPGSQPPIFPPKEPERPKPTTPTPKRQHPQTNRTIATARKPPANCSRAADRDVTQARRSVPRSVLASASAREEGTGSRRMPRESLRSPFPRARCPQRLAKAPPAPHSGRAGGSGARPRLHRGALRRTHPGSVRQHGRGTNRCGQWWGWGTPHTAHPSPLTARRHARTRRPRAGHGPRPLSIAAGAWCGVSDGASCLGGGWVVIVG